MTVSSSLQVGFIANLKNKKSHVTLEQVRPRPYMLRYFCYALTLLGGQARGLG